MAHKIIAGLEEAIRSVHLPFVSRAEFEALQLENYTLRDALWNANEELRKYRKLVNGLRTGLPETMRAFEKTLAKK